MDFMWYSMLMFSLTNKTAYRKGCMQMLNIVALTPAFALDLWQCCDCCVRVQELEVEDKDDIYVIEKIIGEKVEDGQT